MTKMKKAIVIFALTTLGACNGSSEEVKADSTAKVDSIAVQVDSAALTKDSATAKIPTDSSAVK